MALYYNLCIDCGQDIDLAERIVQHFQEFQFDAGVGSPVVCKSYSVLRKEIYFVGVQPKGMGHGTLPEAERRSDLSSPEIVDRVRMTLYAELPAMSGFRRAVFGCECCDDLIGEEPEQDDACDYRNMISSVSIFPDDPPGFEVEAVFPGYRIAKPRSESA